MRRTTIILADDLDVRLRREAKRRGVSIADIAREAIAQHLPIPQGTGRLGFFAAGDGDPDDVSERVDQFVGQAVRSRRRTSAFEGC